MAARVRRKDLYESLYTSKSYFPSPGRRPAPASDRLQSGVHPGRVWRRFAAALVDAVVLAVAQTPLRIALQLMIVGSGKPDPTFLALNALAGIVLGGAYYVYFYTNHGATPGKMVLGLKVISLSSGKNLTPGQTLLREILGKALSFFTLLL
ncbi:MAG: RDD family protein, partial [Bdellovibrionota bacterium]